MDDQILYDLIVHEEWKEDPQPLDEVENYFWQQRGSLFMKLWRLTHGSVGYMLKILRTQFRYKTSFGCPPYHLVTLVNNSLPWAMSLTQDGRYVAILQEKIIEIRSSSSNFSKIIAICKIEADSFPQWRRISWNNDSYLLAYANSFGDIQLYDLTGSLKSIINQTTHGSLKMPGTLSQAVAFLHFANCNEESWNSLLYTVSYQGYLKCYFIKDDGSYKEKFLFSFTKYHPYGISSIVYDEKSCLLVVAGNYGKEPFVTGQDSCYGSHCGISMWRLLHDTPYVAIVEDSGKALKKLSGKELLKYFMSLRRQENDESLKHGIYKIRLSPEASCIVSLHLDGRISLWDFPSMRLKKTWHKSEQPQFDTSTLDSKSEKSFLSNVIDINWWSEKELILSVGSGAVTVSSVQSLTNLLGESPEIFDYWPTLSQAVDGHVLVLECERLITTEGDKVDKNESQHWLGDNVDEDEDEYSFRARLKELSKQTLYFLTESERFLPAIKPAKILTNTYRLVCLKSTNPEELYARKIEMEHYGDALDLAYKFNLNTDLVYQRQWRMKPVTKITIHDYLSKIKDRYWVLDECLLRVPDNFDATEELLKYGLLGTSWKVVEAIEGMKKEDDVVFIMDGSSNVEVDEEDMKTILSTKLSTKQQRICRYRWQLLHYLDRLSTYEVILGGSFKARDKFDPTYFTNFRACNIVNQAIEYARDEDSIALEHILSYHGEQVLPHWLPILSNFPETTNIQDFDAVIPEIGETPEDPEILPWIEKHHRDLDWVEHESISKQNKGDFNFEENLGEFIYESQPELKEFRNCCTQEKLSAWFVWRIHQIDIHSRQIDKCYSLAQLGIERGITGLKELSISLKTLKVLTYDVNISLPLSLKDFLAMSDLSRMKLLMSKATESTFVNNFKSYLVPFLKNISKMSKEKNQNLLHQFLVDIAKTDLSCCLKLFEQCSPELSEPLIPDVADLMRLCIGCIYACKRDDQLNLAFTIVECLPSREEGVLSSQIEELHTQLDQLEFILSGAEILEYHRYPQTVSYVLETKSKANVAREIIQTLIKNTSTKPKPASPKEWNTLLKHLLKLVKDVYTIVDAKTCHQMFVEGLLQSGIKENILMSAEILTTSKTGKVNLHKDTCHLMAATHVLRYDESVNVVVKVAKEYFNSASSLSDHSMVLAKLCFSLITDKPSPIQDEFELIESLNILNNFDVNMLPLQVRLCPDKLDIIDLCLKEGKNNYKKGEQLLKLGRLLKISGEDVAERKGKIKMKIAEVAFENNDFVFSSSYCHQLIDENFRDAWKVCRQLGECEKYVNYISRQKLLSFSLTYCPIHHIEEILNNKTLLDTQVLYEKLSVHMPSTDDDEDADKIEGYHESRSLLQKTTKRTKKLLSGVADTAWISGAMKWVQAGDVDARASNVKDDDVECVQYHPFYRSLDADSDASHCKSTNLNEFCEDLLNVGDDRYTFNQLLLRSQKLSERRAEGELIEDTDAALSNLVETKYGKDSLTSLAYMLALSTPGVVQDIFDKQQKTAFNLLFAAYYCSLQLSTNELNVIDKDIAPVYFVKPKELISLFLEFCGSEEKLSSSEAGQYLVRNLTSLSDVLQARVLQSLNKGVDIERFAVDKEYKKETILGLAMNVDDTLIKTSISLADKYSIDQWEVMLSHVEFLFTDSCLKAKSIRDELNKWDVERILKDHSDEVFDRLIMYVYPEISGKDHSMLLLFYVFLLNCSSPTRLIKGQLSLDAHAKLLKKIKAAAPALDYKQLVHGESPLDVIKTSVKENNVHLLAKIASKIPQVDGSFLSPSDVFLAYINKSFWEPDKNSEKHDWLRHFETCQKFLPKINIKDISSFADHITFSEKSFDLLTHDIRVDITNRLLKYTRQQKGGDKVQSSETDPRDGNEVDSVIRHLETCLNHLRSLKSSHYLELLRSSQTSQVDFAKRYDLSKGDLDDIRNICRDMFLQLESPDIIVGMVTTYKREVGLDQCLQEALKEILQKMQCTGDCSKFSELVANIKTYASNGGEVVSVDDFLQVVRPFCCDVNVDTELKSTVLHSLQEAFQLKGEDVLLLVYFQTDAVISSTWGIRIDQSDVKTDPSRYKLFCKLCADTCTTERAYGLEQLLLSWPVLNATKENHLGEQPWIQVMTKMIDLKQYEPVLTTFKHALKQTRLDTEDCLFIYTKLKKEHSICCGFKILLLSKTKECINQLFKDIDELKLDDLDESLISLLLETKNFYRLVDAPIYTSTIDYVITRSDRTTVDKILKHLLESGFECEAGTLLMRFRGMNSSFYTISNAMTFVKEMFSS